MRPHDDSIHDFIISRLKEIQDHLSLYQEIKCEIFIEDCGFTLTEQGAIIYQNICNRLSLGDDLGWLDPYLISQVIKNFGEADEDILMDNIQKVNQVSVFPASTKTEMFTLARNVKDLETVLGGEYDAEYLPNTTLLATLKKREVGQPPNINPLSIERSLNGGKGIFGKYAIVHLKENSND